MPRRCTEGTALGAQQKGGRGIKAEAKGEKRPRRGTRGTALGAKQKQPGKGMERKIEKRGQDKNRGYVFRAQRVQASKGDGKGTGENKPEQGTWDNELGP